MAVEILWYAPAYISRVCRALPYMGASITDTRAYEPTTLSVHAVKAYSCRSDCWFLSFGEVRQLWTCRYCHMSSDRLVALLIKRKEVSGHVSIAVIGRCVDVSPQYQNPIESGEEGEKSERR